jgi:UPF0755 protein
MRRLPKLNLSKHSRRWRSWPVITAVIVLILLGGVLAARSWYNRNLGPVDASSSQNVNFTVVSGSTVHEIADDLKRAKLIRSSQAFVTYVRGKDLFSQLQAGTYTFSQSMSTPQIVDKMVKGDVAKGLLTIPSGKTNKQIRQIFKNAGYNDAELDIAFSSVTYAGHPALASLPQGATLEGYIYPDSYQKTADTPPTAIIRQSLDEMQTKLTPQIISGFAAQGLSTYQGITMASIIEKESGNPKYNPTIAQVFELRLKQNMMLGSDVTALYGAVADHVQLPDNPEVAAVTAINHDSPYNTRVHTGLPPGPISNMTGDSLSAAAFPSNTDYLYFVNGGDCVIHFSHTEAEHEAAIAKYGAKECS